MATKNIFAEFGLSSKFVNLIYRELMKRYFLAYADVLALYYGRPHGYYNRITCSSEMGYGELKKAFPEVLKALERAYPGCIGDNGCTGKGKSYRYTGKYDDPLAAERKAVAQKETLPFDTHSDGTYVEVTLTIEPNRELRGKILAYGQYLEFVAPQSLREQIKEIVRLQMEAYLHD